MRALAACALALGGCLQRAEPIEIVLPPGPPAPALSAFEAAPPNRSLIGKWGGRVTEGDLAYVMTVTFKTEEAAEFYYGPPFGCRGTWRRAEAGEREAAFTETIVEQGDRECGDDGAIKLVFQRDGSLAYTWGDDQATARLRREP